MRTGFGFGAPGASGMRRPSRIMLSPNSSSDGHFLSPRTPENSHHGFVPGAGMATPSTDTGSVVCDDGYQLVDENTLPIAHLNLELQHQMQVASDIMPRQGMNQLVDLSHIWSEYPFSPAPSHVSLDQPAHTSWMFQNDGGAGNGAAMTESHFPVSQNQGSNPWGHTAHRHLVMATDHTNHQPLDSQVLALRRGMLSPPNESFPQFCLPLSQNHYSVPTHVPTRASSSVWDASRVAASNELHQLQRVQQHAGLHGNPIVQDPGVNILRMLPPTGPSAQQSARSYGQPNRHPQPTNGQANVPYSAYPTQHPVQQLLPPAPNPSPATVPASTYNGRPTGRSGFAPMHAVRQQYYGGSGPDHKIRVPNNLSPMFSDKYHGMHSPTNASVEHLRPEENCALWLTNLPPRITHKQLLGMIRNVGRIWCSFINYPEHGRHSTAAAKVVFFTPEAAQIFLAMTVDNDIRFGHLIVKCAHNRIKSATKEYELVTRKSRVLIITGMSVFVNEYYLTKYFKDRFIFQTDEVITLSHQHGISRLEWRFGSYRCQSQMGKMSLEKDAPFWLQKVEFGNDPCEHDEVKEEEKN